MNLWMKHQAVSMGKWLCILMVFGILALARPSAVRASDNMELSVYYQDLKEAEIIWYDDASCDTYTVERKGGRQGVSYDANYRKLGQEPAGGAYITFHDKTGMVINGVYTYRVRGYLGDSLVREGEMTVRTEVARAELRRPSGVQYSTSYIKIEAWSEDASRSIEADKFEIWRKDLTKKQKKYQKIAEKSVKNGSITYKDTSVKKYHKYSYLIKSYIKSGSKKVYGRDSAAQTYMASTMTPSYKVKVIKPYSRSKGTVTICLTSGSKNGELKFRAGDYVLESERGSKSYSATIRPKKYSSNGKSWKKMKKSVTLKRNKALYLQLTVPKAERKLVVKKPKVLLLQMVPSYNGVDYSSTIDLLKKKADVYQVEFDADSDD